MEAALTTALEAAACRFLFLASCPRLDAHRAFSSIRAPLAGAAHDAQAFARGG